MNYEQTQQGGRNTEKPTSHGTSPVRADLARTGRCHRCESKVGFTRHWPAISPRLLGHLAESV